METLHQPVISDAREMKGVDDQSIDLVVTSPPYPMIEMWDAVFSQLSSRAKTSLETQDGPGAFEAMHQVLDQVWQECFRVLRPGGFACINIGDATRTVNGSFQLFPNHARILSAAHLFGFSVLPCIIWRKQTNAPNKYMGSGMLPGGAYVTLEHEYILILRKGGKRDFSQQRELRQESAIFWEERNLWFSDVWLDLKGSRQAMTEQNGRRRSGAFPFELAFRLINMYSIKGDRVLDPFLGTGTTMAAAMAAGRNSLGVEVDPALAPVISERFQDIAAIGKALAEQRLIRHISFASQRIQSGKPLKYTNAHYGFPVITRQEQHLLLNRPLALNRSSAADLIITYDPSPQPLFCRNWEDLLASPKASDLFGDLASG